MANQLVNITDWHFEDIENEFVIYGFGRTEEGQSIGLRIYGFQPEFYIRIFSDSMENNNIMNNIETNISDVINNLNILSSRHLYCSKTDKYSKKNDSEESSENSDGLTQNKCKCLSCKNIELLDYIGYTTKIENISSDTCIIKKKDLYDGFNWDEENQTELSYYSFLKIIFTNLKSFNKIRKFLSKEVFHPYAKRKVSNKYISIDYKKLNHTSININLYESDMPPLLRFFHKKNINPSGWISIPKNKLHNITNENVFNCELLYEVNYDSIESSDKLNIGKLKILSWDIEADSEYGDFPQPIKEYHKQAKDIVEYYNLKIQNKEPITEQHIYYILQKMFDYSFDKLDNDIKVDLESISKIYFKNNIVNLVKRDLKIKTGKSITNENVYNYILKFHKKIYNICEKYNNKNLDLDSTNTTIEELFNKNNSNNNTSKELDESDSEDDNDIMKTNSNIKTNKDIMIYKINNLLLTKIGKYVRGDRLTQIGAVFQIYGDTNYDKFILTLGSCSDYDTDCILIDTKNKSNSNIISEALSYNYEYTKIISFYDTEEYDNYNNKVLDKLEKNVILAYKELILQYDPDIILAYNNFGFDNQFIMKRAQELNIIEEFSNISKINEYKCELKEKNLSSAALGDNILQLIDTPGRVHIDLLKVIQRDFKLESYKLDNVAEHFLDEHKDDVSANQIFEYQKLDRHHRGIIAKYCVQDCVLLLNLITKLNICSNNIGMANVCSIPLSFIFLRGQGIKIQSLVGKFCLDKDVLLKTLDKSGSDDSYEGAVVLPPTIGMYIQKAVAVLDYASLYPSSMIGSNISQDSKVYSEMTKYESLDQIMNLDFSDMRQQLTFKNLETYLLKKYDLDEANRLLYEIPVRYQCYPLLDSIYIPEINKRYIRFKNIYKLYKQSRDNPTNNPNLNIKNFDYMDIYFDTYKGKGDKKYKTGIKKVTYASNTNGSKGILPQILQFLLSQRKAVRKKIPLESDPFKKDILEGYQLAYKLCANSLYGQTGSSTSVISDIDLASSTTAIGRQMLSLCKSFGEQYYKANVVYGDSVTGDEPLILQNERGLIEIKTIETLSNEWETYENFKPFDTISSNRRNKQKAFVNYKVFANNKWNPIKKVIRHKTNKKIFRINTHCGVVDVTEDHSLLNEHEEIIKPNDCIINETKLLQSFPKFTNNIPLDLTEIINILDQYEKYDRNIEEQLAFIYGIFYGDGLCGIYNYTYGKKYLWAINNKDRKLLQMCKKYLINIFPESNFKILETLHSSGVLKLISTENIKYLVCKFRKLFYNKNKYKIIPDIIINGTTNIRENFFLGYYFTEGYKCYNSKNKNICFSNKDKIGSSQLYYICKSLGYNCSLCISNDKQNIYKIICTIHKPRKETNILKKIELLRDSENEYVYDLETEYGTFNAGIGEITVKNTDSIFNIYHESVFQSKYNNENNLLALLNEHLDTPINLENNNKLTNEIRDLTENMNQVPGKMMLKISILRSIILSNEIATLLRSPHDLEYEKTFTPFILFSKKRYVGNLYELDPGKGKLKYMGIVLKRRDNANIVKMIYKDIIEKIMYENNIEASIEYLQKCLNNLLDGKYKIEDLTITKTLRGFYKNRSMIAHAVLADRISKRTGEKVSSNTRIPYVYICVPEKKGINILQGNRIETPEYIIENKLKIDYGYYITNQLMKPIIQIYDLIMKEPNKIFEDALRKSNNHKNNFKEISNWFKPVNNTTLKTKIKIEKGCVYVIQKSKSVQQKCNRDCVANSNFCKKHIKM